MRLYVKNFPFTTVEAELEAFFRDYGGAGCYIVRDHDGTSRGRGFIDAEPEALALDGVEFQGRTLGVAPATSRRSAA